MAPTKEIPPVARMTRARGLLKSINSRLSNVKAKLGIRTTLGQLRVTKPVLKPKTMPKPNPVATKAKVNNQATDTAVNVDNPKKPSNIDETPAPTPTCPALHLTHFSIGRPLGKGKYGQVYLAKHHATNYICALKMINKASIRRCEEERLVRREIEVHQNLAHPNILRLLGWFHDDERIYLVLEYAPGSSLFQALRGQPGGRFREEVAARYVAQMALALRYMHGKNVMHRDIKPENILLGLHNEIKLADFGYSVHAPSGLRSTVCGTLDYISPEVAVMMVYPEKPREFYTKAIDQWSLGVLAHELIVGKPPFEMRDMEQTKRKIAKFKGRVKVPEFVSREAGEFISQLLNLAAEERMGLDDVLDHPWIAQHIGKSVQAKLSGVV